MKSKKYLNDFHNNFKNALPVIVFFIILFYTMILFFGTRYSIIVSFTTTVFQIRRQRSFTLRGVFLLLLEQLVICILAFLATLNLPLCILLNAFVPFFLVYLQSTQFYPKGYFTNAMAFVFLQLLPVGWSGLLPLAGAIAYAMGVLILALYLVSRVHQSSQNYAQARKGLAVLADEFALMASDNYDTEHLNQHLNQLLELQGMLHNMAYKSRGTRHVVRGEGKVHYMFALLFQRASYFIQDYVPENETKRVADCRALERISDFLKRTGQNLNLNDNELLMQEACELLGEIDGLSERFYIFIRNFLHLLVLTLQDITEISQEKNTSSWKLPANVRPLKGIKERFSLDSFEVRFALRLSFVMVISFTICRATNINHSYWLPLNAFLLVQPMYEDSAHRLKTRLTGTVIGSTLAFLVLSHLHGLTGHFAFATVMISLMYCFVPGSVIQAVCSTGFALSLTSLTMNSATAVELRIAYVLAAVILVLIANRFFFQTSLHGQFHHNMKELFHVEESYLTMLDTSTRRQIDYGVISESLTHFHLLYKQVKDYLKTLENEDISRYLDLLKCFWKMTATAEQMIFYVQTERLEPEKSHAVRIFSESLKKELAKAKADYLHPQASSSDPASVYEEIHEPYLTHLMLKYTDETQRLQNICQGNWKRL